MGGSRSKKQTAGYRLYVDMQVVVCAGPIDGVSRLTWDGKEGWSGWSPGGRINVNKPGLFGGDKREGGVSGAIDFCPGGPGQMPNDYLVAKLGPLVNAARGAATLVLRGLYVGLNPYLKRMAVRATCLHQQGAEGAPQWYDAKVAPITSIAGEFVSFAEDFAAGLASYTLTDGSLAAFSIESDVYDNALVVNTAGNLRDAISRSVSSASGFVGFRVNCKVTSADVGDFGDMEFSGPAGLVRLNLGGYNVYDPPNPVLPRVTTPAGHVFFSTGLVLDVWYRVEVLFTGDAGTATLRRLDTDQVVSSIALPTGGLVFASIDTMRFVNLNFLPGTSNRWSRFRLYSHVRIGDMNPAHMIREAWTDPRMGMGLSAADIDDDALMAAADYYFDQRIGFSALWSEETPAGDFIDEVCRHANAEWYVDRRTGKLVLYPIRDDYDPAALLVLDRTNSDPVENLTQPLPGEMLNSITVQFRNEDAGGKDGAVTVHNDALAGGGLNGKTVKYGFITHRELAARVADRDLRVCGAPLRSCTVMANRQASGLNKGHPFKLNRPEVGLNNVVMRVTDIDFGDGRDNRVRISCVEDVFQMPALPTVAVGGGEGPSPVRAPAPAPARLVTEAPYLYLVRAAGQRQTDEELAYFPEASYLMVAAQRPSGDAIHAGLAVDAGAGYEETATLDFSPVATLTADVGRLDALLTISGGVDLEDVVAGALAQVGDELMRVDAIDAEAGTVTVGRGVLDTVPGPHLAGARVWFLDLAADGDEVQHAAGDVLAVKVLPETGQGQLDPALAPADSVTLAARAIRPYPPADVRINGAYFPTSVTSPVTVTWVDRNRVQQTAAALLDWLDGGVTPEAGQTTVVELWSGATLVESWPGETDGTVTLTVATSGTYTVRAYSQRAGHDSWTAFEHTLEILGGAERVSESGGARAMEDGTLRGIE